MSEARGVVLVETVQAQAYAPEMVQGAGVDPTAVGANTSFSGSVSMAEYMRAQQAGGASSPDHIVGPTGEWPSTRHLVGSTPDYAAEPHGLPYDHPDHKAMTVRTWAFLTAGVAAGVLLVGNVIGAFSTNKPDHSPVNHQPGVITPTQHNRPGGIQLP